jgi:hypothetical protein
LANVNMVCASLRSSIPKSVVYCQVFEAISLQNWGVRIPIPFPILSIPETEDS